MVVWKKKNPGYVDLGEKLRKREEKIANFKSNMDEIDEPETKPETSNSGFFGFFGGNAEKESTPTLDETAEEKRKKLGKRLMEITNRLEEQEKEIYQLKQKLEVLERKQRVGY